MKGYLAFFYKEVMESVRSYKLFIILAIFIMFGIMSPMMAKLLPEIMKSLIDDKAALEALNLGEPTQLDSYMQFFKNITQLGLIAVVLLFSNSLSNEISKKTLLPLFTRGLSKTSMMLAKLSVITLLWTIAYAVGFIITYLYTIMLFPNIEIYNLFISVFCVWLFGLVLLSVLMLGSTLTASSYAPLLFVGIFVAVLMFINILPDAIYYNPIVLIGDNVAMLAKTYQLSDVLPAIFISIGIIILSWFGGIRIFSKKIL